MSKLTARLIELNPNVADSLTASKIYYDNTTTIREKIDLLSQGQDLEIQVIDGGNAFQ